MKFEMRTSAPSKTNKYYINYKKGGYNTCIVIDSTTGFVIPNCVGYAQGRMLEMSGAKAVNWKLPACNAEDWYETAQKNGLAVSQTPEVGSIFVWRVGNTHDGGDGFGHVAVVEKINADGSVITSESGYNSTEWYSKTRKNDGNWGQPARYTFIGFIRPIVEFDAETGTEVQSSETATAAVSFKDGDLVKLKEGCTYYNGKAIPKWVFNSKLYYRGKNANGIIFSTLKVGAITGVVKAENISLASTVATTLYKVQVTTSALNVRKGPGTSYAAVACIRDRGTYDILEVSGNWGRIAADKWICLDYTKKV